MSWLDPRQWLLIATFVLAGTVGVNFWSARLRDQGDAAGYARARGEYNSSLVAAQATAAKETARMQKEKDDAETKAAERQKLQNRDAARLRDERDGLRNDLTTARVRLRDAPVEAVREYATAASDVFEQCAARYSAVAGDADGHASDALKLQDAWPR